MTVSEATYLDTSVFIYIIENHATYSPKLEQFMEGSLESGAKFVTSTVTLAEFGVQPERLARQDLIQAFHDFIRDLPIELNPLNLTAAVHAYGLRAKYASLRALDALQLGAALAAGCRVFLTNDFDLKKVSEIQVLLVADL